MKKGLSSLANYARDRGICYVLMGQCSDTLFFNVREIRSARIRRNFEKQLRADNPGSPIDIKYIGRGKSLVNPA